MDLAGLTLIALLIVVAASCTSRINPGIVAIALGWVLAAIIAPRFGAAIGPSALVNSFPTELFLTLLGVSLLFALAEANGTLEKVTLKMLATVGSVRVFVPWMFFLLAFLLGSAGPGNIAVAGLIAPVAMQFAQKQRFSPLLMAAIVGHGAIASTTSPLTAAGIVANQKLAELGIVNVAWQIFAWNASANLVAAAMAYAAFGRTNFQNPLSCDRSDLVSPDTTVVFSTGQRVTVTIIALVLVAAAIFRVHIGLAAFWGAVLLILSRAADERSAIVRIPWAVIVMVTGVSILTSLLDKAGGSERFAQIIGRFSTSSTLPAVVGLVTGVVSIYSSTTGVVLPAFLPMVKQFASLHEGTSALNLALAVVVSGNLVDMSPLSTIGALCLAAMPAAADRQRLFNGLLAWGFAMALLGALISWLCFSA